MSGTHLTDEAIVRATVEKGGMDNLKAPDIKHLAECGDCADTLRGAWEMANIVRNAEGSEPPPTFDTAAMWERLQAAMKRQEDTTTT